MSAPSRPPKCLSSLAQVKEHLSTGGVAHCKSTAANPIILYDIRSTQGAWSPNVWKTRFILNYKGIPYRTEWLGITEIKPTQLKLGIPPTAPGRYTLPMIAVPTTDDTASGEKIYVLDSAVIAEYLEHLYPERPIFPAGTRSFQALFQTWAIDSMYPHMRLLVVPCLPEVMECETSKEYYLTTRSAMYGQPLKDIYPKGEAKREVLEKWKKDLGALDEAMSRNGVGDYVMGQTMSYADMILVGLLVDVKIASSGEELDGDDFPTTWDVMKDWHGGRWARLMDAMAPYMKQD